MTLLTVLNILYIPMAFTYNINKHDYMISDYLYSVLPSYIFTIDILLCFFKGYYKKGFFNIASLAF